jgi:hypothetical protein
MLHLLRLSQGNELSDAHVLGALLAATADSWATNAILPAPPTDQWFAAWSTLSRLLHAEASFATSDTRRALERQFNIEQQAQRTKMLND